MMKIMRIVILGLATILGGCVMSSEVYLPDGTKGFNISCNGSANSISNCFEKAGDICGAKGYDLFNREGQAIPFALSSGSAYANSFCGSAGFSSTQGMLVTRGISVRCKK
ncbi:MAG: hypothetical protein Q8N30_04290 [Methylococcales bacterium]|nr:hypothetical protein [Methylococcales bacterium]